MSPKTTNMEERKKRGCNYTASERDFLLKLVQKYQDIIENKDTKATMVAKKREAWICVCKQFNAVAVSGFRTWQQLRHLYENMKQRSKRIVHKKEINLAAINTDEDVELNKTIYKCEPPDHDIQIELVVSPQPHEPISNPYSDEPLNSGQSPREAASDMSNVSNLEEDRSTSANISDSNSVLTSIKKEPEEDVWVNTENECNKPQINCCHTCCGKTRSPEKSAKRALQMQYFKTRLRNAILQTKYLNNKHKMDMTRNKLQIQILRLRLDKLRRGRKF